MNRKWLVSLFILVLTVVTVMCTFPGTISDSSLLIAIAALMGAVTGFFARVLIHRVPLMMHSPDPGFTLFSPVLRCPAKIGWHYPFTELLFSLSAVLLVCLLPQLPSALMALLLFLLLWTLAAIDLQHGLLPDMLTQPLVWAGLLCCVSGISRLSLGEAVTGAAVGWFSLWTLYWLVFCSTGKEGLGYGDCKLFAGLGAWNGWEALPHILLLATGFTLLHPLWRLIQRRVDWRDAYPFGPGLSVSGGMYWLVAEMG